METSTTDIAISIALTLFMLSLITEKVSNFIKLNVHSLSLKIPENEEWEKRRERKIQILSGAVGIVVALTCNANFFQLIKSAGPVSISGFWTDMGIGAVIGCVITGLFLSQGSKFFHDLLDTLLFYKNTKRLLSNKQEIENKLLESRTAYTADTFIAKVTADQRDDDDDYNA